MDNSLILTIPLFVKPLSKAFDIPYLHRESDLFPLNENIVWLHDSFITRDRVINSEFRLKSFLLPIREDYQIDGITWEEIYELCASCKAQV